jgi:hypothetical protein
MLEGYFDYMRENFFDSLCSINNMNYGTVFSYFGCQCNGFDFYGMPSVQFIYSTIADEDESGHD